MEQDLLLIHGSNYPSLFCPELLPLDITKVALVFVPTESTTPELYLGMPNKLLAPFTHADFANPAPDFVAALPLETASYHLMATELPPQSMVPSTKATLDALKILSQVAAGGWTTSSFGPPQFKL
jgi:hypothetical protein